MVTIELSIIMDNLIDSLTFTMMEVLNDQIRVGYRSQGQIG